MSWLVRAKRVYAFCLLGFYHRQNWLRPLLSRRSNCDKASRLVRSPRLKLYFLYGETWPRRDSNACKTRFRKPPLYPTELRSHTFIIHLLSKLRNDVKNKITIYICTCLMYNKKRKWKCITKRRKRIRRKKR